MFGEIREAIDLSTAITNSVKNSADRELPRALPAEVADRLAARAVAGGAPSVKVHAPATGAKIVDLPQPSPDDIETAFATARDAQREWAARPVAERAAVFKYTDSQTIAVQDLLPIAPLPGMSDETWAKTMTLAFPAMRLIGLK